MSGIFSKTEYIIIIGCGRLGSTLANDASNNGYDVLVIDSDEDAFRRLHCSYNGLTLTGDGSDIEVLESANISKADTIIVVTDNDNLNILIAQLVNKITTCKHIIIRLYDQQQSLLCDSHEISVICPIELAFNQINDILHRKGDDKYEDKSFNYWRIS